MATTVVIKDDRRRYDKLRREMRQSFGVEVGYWENMFTHSSGVDIALIAIAHEFGIKKLNIPERSFFRSAIDQNRGKLNRFINKLITKVIFLEMTWRRASIKLAEFAIDLIRKKIDASKSWVTVGLKPRTIAKKGHDTPLVDTGEMRRRIHWKKTRG